jgi:hypothetical protein
VLTKIYIIINQVFTALVNKKINKNVLIDMLSFSSNGCFFKFGIEVGVEELIVNAPHFLHVFNMQFEKSVFLRRVVDKLFKSNLTFCVVYVFNLKF